MYLCIHIKYVGLISNDYDEDLEELWEDKDNAVATVAKFLFSFYQLNVGITSIAVGLNITFLF